MKLSTFLYDGEHRLGAVVAGEMVDLCAYDASLPNDMSQFLALGPDALAVARAAIAGTTPRRAVQEISLMAPVPRPAKVFGIGLNYGSFVTALTESSTGGMPPKRVWFGRQQACVTGPGDDVWMPLGSSQLDYEGELAIVIGTRCRGIDAREARNFIAGYTVCNDLTVRDWAAISPLLGKSLATHAPMGPWITTADEIDDPQQLTITTTVNGVMCQSASTADMLSGCFELVAELSAATALEPGDIILSGTPAGCGVLRRPPIYLKPGDEVRVDIEGIGAIVNRVIQEPLQ